MTFKQFIKILSIATSRIIYFDENGYIKILKQILVRRKFMRNKIKNFNSSRICKE